MRPAGRASTLAVGLLLAAGGWALVPGVRADGHIDDAQQQQQRRQQKKSADSDAALMEFLGGIGSEDEEWIDYLSRTDPTKVAADPKHARPDGSRPENSSDGSQK